MNEDKSGYNSPNARDAAIDWLMRQNDGPWTATDQVEFDSWIARDPGNKAAFDDIAGMFAHLTTMEFDIKPETKPTPLIWRSAGLSVIATAVVALFLFFDDLSLYLRSDYYAGTGETRLVALADGSNVQLDAQSAIAVRFKVDERRLTLLQGQAWFEVASDVAHPFVVEAAGGTITALGTAFDVSIEKGQALVAVTEHRVSVTSGGRNVIVDEGQQSTFAKALPAQPAAPADIERVTSWRRGKLVFENRQLDEVVEVLSRYHRGAVYFLDPSLRARRVTGVFGADDPLLALEEIQVALGLRMVAVSKFLIFLF